MVVFKPPPPQKSQHNKQTKNMCDTIKLSVLKVYATQHTTTSFTGRWFPTYPKRASDLVVRNDCCAKAKLEGYLEERDKSIPVASQWQQTKFQQSTCLTQSSEDNNYIHGTDREKKQGK